jgi:hypothetical protein
LQILPHTFDFAGQLSADRLQLTLKFRPRAQHKRRVRRALDPVAHPHNEQTGLTRELRQALRSKDQQHDHQDQQDFARTDS